MQITKELIKIFVNWTKLKIRLHTVEREIFPHEREIWWASLGQNVGVEINGKNDNYERPVLIVRKFNNQMLLILPITSKVKSNPYYHQFKSSTRELNSAILSQIRLVSGKRLVRKIETINDRDFSEISAKLRKLF